MNANIQTIKDAGFRVFVRPGEATYCFFTDGVRIGYAQWDTFREHVSSVHVPNRTTGTGLQVADEITADSLNRAIACHAPGWATISERESVVKWKNFDAYLKASKFNSELIEVS